MALHPVHQVYDGVFNTASGRIINLLNPTAEEINLYDIAKGLSNICRFGGQCQRFHSVAKHTLLVWYLAPKHLKQVALLHDASEAYLGDVIKPLKVLIADQYNPFEDLFTEIIFKKYHVNKLLLPDLKPYDMAALSHEHRYIHEGDQYMPRLFRESISELLAEGNAFTQLLDLFEREFGQYD